MSRSFYFTSMNKQTISNFRGFIFLFIAILSVITSSCTMAVKKEKTNTKPNIIIIMSDDHAYQAISAYDNRFIETPNIDRLAEEGLLFNNSFVTNSICSPSRAVMLTGKFSHINGLRDNKDTFDGSQQTFPKLLQQAGYQTAIVGKWHLKSQPTGFDYWNILPGQGVYYHPDFIEMGEKKRYEGYVTQITSDIAIDWMDNKRDTNKAFCLLIHHKAVHRTWEPDTSSFDEFKNKQYDLPSTFFDDYSSREAAAAQQMSIRSSDLDLVYDLKMESDSIICRFGKMTHTSRMNAKQKERWEAYYQPKTSDFLAHHPQGKELDIWKYQRYMQDYLACVRSLDDNIGRILDYLDEQKLTDNTIIIYTSDQGFYLGEHSWFDKRFMYEQSMRTPLIIRYPKQIKAGQKTDALVQNIDYAPTLLTIAGIDIPKDIQGISLTPLFENNKLNLRDALYYHYYEFPNEHMVKRHYGIRTGRYKLIHFYYDIDEWELFDLKTDPDELINQYNNKEYSEIAKNLHQKLNDLRKQYQDTDF